MKCWRVMLLVMALTLVAGMAHAIPPPDGTVYTQAMDQLGVFNVTHEKNGVNGGPAHIYNWTVGFTGMSEPLYTQITGWNDNAEETQRMKGFALWDIPIQGAQQRLWVIQDSYPYQIAPIGQNPTEASPVGYWHAPGDGTPDAPGVWRNTDRIYWNTDYRDGMVPVDHAIWNFKLGFDQELPQSYLDQATWQRQTAIWVEWKTGNQLGPDGPEETRSIWVAETPEPMSALLLALGIPAVLAARSRRRGDD